MDAGLLRQTVVSGALVSAVILGLLMGFSGWRRWPRIVVAVILLDQGSKWLIADTVRQGATYSYLGGALQIGHYTNFLQGFGASTNWLLGGTLVGIVGVIRLCQMLGERGYFMSGAVEAGLALILGGVAVIAAERALSGCVVDFLQFGINGAYVYNIADLAVFAGGFILCARAMVALPQAIEQEAAPVASAVDRTQR
jgi:lipoprotein signal peptidase